MRSLALSHKGTIEATLASIARHYLPPGALVRVMVTDLAGDFLLGQARRLDSGYLLIELDWRAALDGQTFFHELAHHVKEHVTRTSTLDAAPVRLSQLALSAEQRAIMTKVLDRMEQDADDWAWRTLRAFERRFGPFEQAVIGETAVQNDGLGDS